MCFLSVLGGGGEVGGAKTYESVKKCVLQLLPLYLCNKRLKCRALLSVYEMRS